MSVKVTWKMIEDKKNWIIHKYKVNLVIISDDKDFYSVFVNGLGICNCKSKKALFDALMVIENTFRSVEYVG